VVADERAGLAVPRAVQKKVISTPLGRVCNRDRHRECHFADARRRWEQKALLRIGIRYLAGKCAPARSWTDEAHAAGSAVASQPSEAHGRRLRAFEHPR
jgi:hypothetical protein